MDWSSASPEVALIGVQCFFIHYSVVTQTRSRVLLTAVGVTVFDVTLALACFFGVGAVIDRYEWLKAVIPFAGSLIAVCIRVMLIGAKSEEVAPSRTPLSIPALISSTCVVT